MILVEEFQNLDNALGNLRLVRLVGRHVSLLSSLLMNRVVQ